MRKQISATSPIFGIDDGGFQLFNSNWNKVRVFGVVTRGAQYTDYITQIDLDKDDIEATDKIIQLVKNLPNNSNIRAILHQGVTIAGFGMLDLNKINLKTSIPIVTVLTREPNIQKITNALLTNVKRGKERLEILDKLPQLEYVEDIGVYLQVAGISLEKAAEIVKKCTAIGKIPEALRLAHLMGQSYYNYKRSTINPHSTNLLKHEVL